MTSSLLSSERFIGVDLHKHSSIKYEAKHFGNLDIKAEERAWGEFPLRGTRTFSPRVTLEVLATEGHIS